MFYAAVPAAAAAAAAMGVDHRVDRGTCVLT